MFRASLLNKYWRLPPSPAWVSVRRSCDTYVILFIYVIQLHYLRRENKTCNTFSKFTVSGGVSQLLIYPVVSGGATTVFHINRTSERGKFSCLHSSFRLSMLSVFSMYMLSLICLFMGSPLNLPVTFMVNRPIL